MPEKYGVCVSEDFMAVVSAEITGEFIAPYLSRLGKEFGGCLVHTCGGLNHGIKALKDKPHIIGVNCSATETDAVKLTEDGGSGLRYILHHQLLAIPPLKVLTNSEHISLCKELSKKEPIMCIVHPVLGYDPNTEPEILKRLSIKG